MKKILIAAAIILTTATVSNAADIRISKPVLASFQTTFVHASEVKWSTVRDCYQAEFFADGEYKTALFNAEGELIATTKNISSSELPAKLQKRLKKGMHDKWITGLIKVSDDKGTRYYVTLENAKETVTMGSEYSAKWNTVQVAQK